MTSASIVTIRVAAVLYTPTTPATAILGPFARVIAGRGFRVGGIVQEMLFDTDGHKDGLDAIEIDTGRRIPINRPTKSDRIHGTCSLDHSALAESSGAIRRAVGERMDLIVIEKFGEQEQNGRGLAAEILAAISEGLPTLVLVPAIALEEWTRFTGGAGDLLPCRPEALDGWWDEINDHGNCVK